MTDEKWLDLKVNIKEKFEVLEDKTENLMIDKGEGQEKLGTIDILVSQTPMGKIKLERINKPVVLDKKVQYHRKKEGSQIEYIYSDTEWTHRLEAYKWSDQDQEWQKIDASTFADQ
jgi:hypothetical protein